MCCLRGACVDAFFEECFKLWRCRDLVEFAAFVYSTDDVVGEVNIIYSKPDCRVGAAPRQEQ